MIESKWRVYDKIETNFNNGVNWLDEHVPQWWKKIDVSSFNLRSASSCICGQLFAQDLNLKVAGLIDGLDSRRIEKDLAFSNVGFYRAEGLFGTQWATDNGFTINSDSNYIIDGSSGLAWDYLAELWIEEIQERQGR